MTQPRLGMALIGVGKERDNLQPELVIALAP